MDDTLEYTLKHHLEVEVNRIFEKYGSSKRQRDAFYYGYRAGEEVVRKKRCESPETNFLGDLDVHNEILLRRQLNQFFVTLGLTSKERVHFQKGIDLGVSSLDQTDNKKSIHY